MSRRLNPAAAAYSNGKVRVWNPTNGRERVFELGPPLGSVWQVAFDPTGRYLATANGNGTVYILRLKERPAKNDAD